MSRLFTQPVSEAGAAVAPLFAAIQGAMGKVPNAYATVGSNSPLALDAVLKLDGALRKSTLKAAEIEVVKLATSQVAACDYCLAAHTMVAKKLGLTAEAILALRHGKPSGDSRNDALAALTRSLVATRGTVDAGVVDAARAAGLSDAQMVDVLLAISAITFTNLFNRLNDTALDFPPAD